MHTLENNRTLSRTPAPKPRTPSPNPEHPHLNLITRTLSGTPVNPPEHLYLIQNTHNHPSTPAP